MPKAVILEYLVSLNKKLWTSSYVLFAAGCTLLLVAACYWLTEYQAVEARVDVALNCLRLKRNRRLHCVGAPGLHPLHHSCAPGRQSHDPSSGDLRKKLLRIADLSLGSLACSIVDVLVRLVPSAFLYRKGIFIRSQEAPWSEWHKPAILAI